MRGSTNATAVLPTSTKTITVGGMSIKRTIYGKVVTYTMMNQTTPTAGDYVVDTEVSPQGFIYQPIFNSGDYTLVGVFYSGNGTTIRVIQGGMPWSGATLTFIMA